jgi:hypothetical protein
MNEKRKTKIPSYLKDYEISNEPINENEKNQFELKSTPKYLEDGPNLKDTKLFTLNKFMRPYFSPHYNSWEMDFMIIPHD